VRPFLTVSGLVALVASSGCDTSILVHIVPAPELSMPSYAIIDMYTDSGLSGGDRRVPESGRIALPARYEIPIEDGVDGEARLLTRAYVEPDRWVGEGTGRVYIHPGSQVTVMVLLLPFPLPDCDGDGVPNMIDSCPKTPNPEQRPCEDRTTDGCVSAPDAGAPDARGEAGAKGDAPLPGPDAALCSPAGVATSCDPIAASGCAAGRCYVLKGTGPACVCPEGGADEGGSCSTTTDCKAGHVCAGSSSPGTCRVTCDPQRSDPCGSGASCVPITSIPGYGYCSP
jgi:hypothetical protein